MGLISAPQRMSLHLLMYFTHWINVHLQQANTSQLTETHARWIFALLAHVGDFISSDDINLLRNLARACLALLKHLVQERVIIGGGSELQGLVLGEQKQGFMGERSCWIIISVIVGVWAQRDLWMDAEAALSEIGTQFDLT
jgi:Survival motor neuron (SMN) interacting protein 1 (SIP1)